MEEVSLLTGGTSTYMMRTIEIGFTDIQITNMKTINFERFEIYTTINHKEVIVQDCREGFANIIYWNGSGVACHALAMKIYKSEGEMEFTDEEITLMKQFAENFGNLSLLDSFDMNVKESTNDNETRKEEQQ